MFRVYKNGQNIDAKVVEYVADTAADVQDLPTDVGSGSTCIVIQGSSGGAEAYMLGGDKVWHPL